MLTPNDIEVLIYCHCCGGEPHPRLHAPAVRAALCAFLRDGVIYSDAADRDGVFRTTAKGAAHLAQLCNLPFPTQLWVGADGKLIE